MIKVKKGWVLVGDGELMNDYEGTAIFYLLKSLAKEDAGNSYVKVKPCKLLIEMGGK